MEPVEGTHDDEGFARCLHESLDGNNLALEQHLTVNSRDIDSPSNCRRNGSGAQGDRCRGRLYDVLVDDHCNDSALRHRHAFESHQQRSAILRPQAGRDSSEHGHRENYTERMCNFHDDSRAYFGNMAFRRPSSSLWCAMNRS